MLFYVVTYVSALFIEPMHTLRIHRRVPIRAKQLKKRMGGRVFESEEV